MRFHLFGTPETFIRASTVVCAFTRKVLLLYKMLKSLGHEVKVYGRDGSQDYPDGIPAEDFEVILTRAQAEELFPGQRDDAIIFAGDWNKGSKLWSMAKEHTIAALKRNLKKYDFIGTEAGLNHEYMCKMFPHNSVVETGIGYEGIFAKYKVFESYAWMHYMYGRWKWNDIDWEDTVIPNFYDPSVFPDPVEPENYFVFVGRLIERKGIWNAVDAVTRAGEMLYVIGPGAKEHGDGWIKVVDDAKKPHIIKGNLKYLGCKNEQDRNNIVKKAKALLCPTKYVGPFEGVHVEANMCGVPVITTDHGVFTETVRNGLNGFRCKTVPEMVWACRNVSSINRSKIKPYALSRFSIDVVKHQYQDYFSMLDFYNRNGYVNLEVKR
jgi:glycosyltransferase involved in cell wall biosynthesis